MRKLLILAFGPTIVMNLWRIVFIESQHPNPQDDYLLIVFQMGSVIILIGITYNLFKLLFYKPKV